MVEALDPHLASVLESAFTSPDGKQPTGTRAVVILHHGRIVAERYAPGFRKDTPLLGWSMTKTVMNALVGIMVKEGRLSLQDPVPVPEWRDPRDPRRKITLHNLLQMSSGLRFREDYGNPLQDVTTMLFGVPDAASYAARKPLAAEPGTRWSYSSGTTNIISRGIREVLGDDEYVEFPRRALFDPLGMGSAVIEPDASGTFIGSSFMYATARDWAKLGQLYLQDGVWGGRRVLPEGWVKYTTTPAPQAPEQKYGAHVWLKIPEEFSSGDSRKALPADAFHAVGHEGQLVSIIPSKDLVVVRLGLTRDLAVWHHDRFIEEVTEVLRKK
jgi:CubicO group peptidase (beta-lactamase class C family)